jgi:hypothetical protein
MAETGQVPFDLDFIRALGFHVGQDWDDELVIEPPEFLDVDSVAELVRRFEKGIKKRLYFEAQRRLSVCVGGPKNGTPADGCSGLSGPVCFHIKRGEWAVYARKRNSNDPRCWFIGTATSKKKARQLWFDKTKSI